MDHLVDMIAFNESLAAKNTIPTNMKLALFTLYRN